MQVGSKRFTESYILGEIITQTAQGPGATAAVHQRGLGNTAILLNALESRSIDVYPEYTGTIAREILKLPDVPPLAELNTRLAPRGLAVAVPLGFNNSYALAVRSSDARRKGPRAHIGPQTASRATPRAVAGVPRPRRWLAQSAARLQIEFPPPKGLDHGLAYEAIAGGQVDVIDIYTTDAKLDKYKLTVLVDDVGFFPRYDAVLLYRADVPTRFPKAWAALAQLEGELDDAAMRRLNAAAELDGKDFAAIASAWLSAGPAQARGTASASDSARADRRFGNVCLRPTLGGLRSSMSDSCSRRWRRVV